ncbi:hypothetical protein CGLO_10822 [Colletotrichum gloeosporioides Cg-14]|uniref:Uncharacterized protein n=1 Tax=Colletotrichum gloeosporioides (strain Cg-14) TaxID=1237896 RepID=T0K9S7_COLGC|nr:hypothetical protein CGLO_10822 [Colletotrichum gloeosporioides Cg-14]
MRSTAFDTYDQHRDPVINAKKQLD